MSKEKALLPLQREIRAYYTSDFIRVYQAYNKTIADSATLNQKFLSPPFKLQRTTWIKSSFFWMMYRCGWGYTENQERILAIDITHEGFLWALTNSCLSHYEMDVYHNVEEWKKIKSVSPVVIQWDPERNMFLDRLHYKSVQIGLTPFAAALYNASWIVKITDITVTSQKIMLLIKDKKTTEASELLPSEKKYFINNDIMKKLGMC